MSIRDFLFPGSGSPATETRSQSSDRVNLTIPVMGSYFNSDLFKNPSVYAVVDKISDKSSGLEWKSYITATKGKRKGVRRHVPLPSFLNGDVSNGLNLYEFKQQLFAGLAADGNAFVYAVRNPATKAIIALQVLPLTSVSIMMVGLERRYYVSGIGQVKINYDLFHYAKGIQSPAVGLAYSPAVACADTLNKHSAIDSYTSDFFSNGMTASGFFQGPKSMNVESATAFTTAIAEQQAKHHRYITLPLGIEFKQLMLNAEQSQLLQSQMFSVEEVARMWHISPGLLGSENKAASVAIRNLQEKRRDLNETTLASYIKTVEEKTSQIFASDPTLTVGLRLDIDTTPLEHGDFETRVTTAVAAISGRLLTPNEGREHVNPMKYLPVEGGDELSPVQSATNVPEAEESGILEEDNG